MRSVAALQYIAGHTAIATTQKYLHPSRDAALEALQQAGRVPNCVPNKSTFQSASERRRLAAPRRKR